MDNLAKQFWAADSALMIESRSPAMQAVYDRIAMAAPTRSTVLLSGETGTGKGVLARMIHHFSDRKEGPFVNVHCGAIPETLIESELFGHQQGAFTGAVRRKRGKFEQAFGGTIFLDEIGTVTAAIQIKLLQVLQDWTFQPVGGEENIHADVRVITASNMDLQQMCGSGEFRQDLYYRLNVFPVQVPALRQRREDIPLFAGTFLKYLNRIYPKKISAMAPGVMEGLMRYHWPGNIRELENLMHRAYIVESSSSLRPSAFPGEIFGGAAEAAVSGSPHRSTLAEYRRRAVEAAERDYLIHVLRSHGGRIDKTAATAGVTRRQIHKLMQRYGLRKETYKRG